MNVTLKAIQQFKAMIAQCPHNEKWGIRISILGENSDVVAHYEACAAQQNGDKIISVEGVTFFLNDAANCLLSGGIIDFNANGFTTNYIGQEGRCCK